MAISNNDNFLIKQRGVLAFIRFLFYIKNLESRKGAIEPLETSVSKRKSEKEVKSHWNVFLRLKV